MIRVRARRAGTPAVAPGVAWLLALAAATLVFAALVPETARAQAGIPYLAAPDRPAKTKPRAKRPVRAETDAAAASEGPAGQRGRATGRAGAGASTAADEASDGASAGGTDGGDAAGAGGAQDGGASGAAATEAAGAQESAAASGGAASGPAVERTAGRPFSFFADLWARRRAALARGDRRQAAELLTTLVDAKLAAGWPDIFVYGDVLARDADAALARGEPREALSLAGAASLLAPHRPSTHYALARAYWASSAGLWATVGSYWHGLVVAWTEPPLARTHLGNFLVALALAALASAAALAVTVLWRHGRLFVHDLQHLLPPGATLLHAALLGAALLLAPVFLRLGPLWAVTTWLVLLGVHYDRRERVGAVLVLVMVAGLAAGLPVVTSQLGYAGSRSEDVYLTVRDAAAEQAAARVRDRQRPGPEELYALGLRARWAGDIPGARAWLDRAAAVLEDDGLLVTAGNVRYLDGDRPGAIAAYQQALRVEPDEVAALFDLSRVYYAMMDHQRAGEAQRRAMSLDLERVERLNDEAKRASGTYLVDGGVPDLLLDLPVDLGPAHERAVARLWSLLGAGGSRQAFAASAAAAAVLLLLLGLVRRAVRPAARCPRCGMPACRRCNPEMPDQAQCGQCFHAFVDKEHVDPQACIRKELQVHRYRARMLRVRQVLSVVLPGSGQLLRGRFARGVLLMTGVFAAAVLVLWATDVLPAPAWTEGGPPGLGVVVAGAVLAVLYVASLIDGLREDR